MYIHIYHCTQISRYFKYTLVYHLNHPNVYMPKQHIYSMYICLAQEGTTNFISLLMQIN